MSERAVLQFRVPMGFEAAEGAVREALQAQGFGILTEVDVQAVMKAKLGIDVARQKLLGACNPKLAHASLAAEPSVGAFLPCGVAVRAGASEGETIVDLQNPGMLAGAFAEPGLAAPAKEAQERLRAALMTIGTPM
jgi:uncharacterized protein (DUF302 family)